MNGKGENRVSDGSSYLHDDFSRFEEVYPSINSFEGYGKGGGIIIPFLGIGIGQVFRMVNSIRNVKSLPH